MIGFGKKVAGNQETFVQMEVVGINGKGVNVKVSVVHKGGPAQEMDPQYLMLGDSYTINLPASDKQ